MSELLPRWQKGSFPYNKLVKEYGQKQVDEVIAQYDEMEQWLPDMSTEQLIKYVGCHHTLDELAESRDYLRENFPDLLENPLLLQTVATGAHNELKLHRNYSHKDKMLEEFYRIMEIDFDEEEEYESGQRPLTTMEKIYSTLILIGLAILMIKIINWLF